MNTEEPKWRKAVPAGLISSNEVHVWRLFYEDANSQLESIQKILSPDELSRARKFRLERDQRRFILSRGILRTILGFYLDEKPDKVRFEYTSFGKPMLVNDFANDNISFNLSHSGEVVLYAVTRNHKIGIDVEQIQDDLDVMQIGRRFFSLSEIDKMKRAHENNRSELFFRYWTRKEAFVKALGLGVSFPMERLDVSLVDKISQTTKSGEGEDDMSCLHVEDLFPADGYAAAVAIEGNDLAISGWHYCDW